VGRSPDGTGAAGQGLAPDPVAGTGDARCRGGAHLEIQIRVSQPLPLAGDTQGPEQGEEMEEKRERSVRVWDAGGSGMGGGSSRQAPQDRAQLGMQGRRPSRGTRSSPTAAPSPGWDAERRARGQLTPPCTRCCALTQRIPLPTHAPTPAPRPAHLQGPHFHGGAGDGAGHGAAALRQLRGQDLPHGGMLLELEAVGGLHRPVGLVQVHVDVVHRHEARVGIPLGCWVPRPAGHPLLSSGTEGALLPSEGLEAAAPARQHHVVALAGGLGGPQPAVLQGPKAALRAQVDGTRRLQAELLRRRVTQLAQTRHHVRRHLGDLDQDAGGRDVPRQAGEAQATLRGGVELGVFIPVERDAGQGARDGGGVAGVHLLEQHCGQGAGSAPALGVWGEGREAARTPSVLGLCTLPVPPRHGAVTAPSPAQGGAGETSPV